MNPKNDFLRVFLATLFGIAIGLILTVDLLKVSVWYSLVVALSCGSIAYVAEDIKGFFLAIGRGFLRTRQIVPAFSQMLKQIKVQLVRFGKAFKNYDWKVMGWTFLEGNSLATYIILILICLVGFGLLFNEEVNNSRANFSQIVFGFLVLDVFFSVLFGSLAVASVRYCSRTKLINDAKSATKFHPVTIPFWLVYGVFAFVRFVVRSMRQAGRKMVFWNAVFVTNCFVWSILLVKGFDFAVLGSWVGPEKGSNSYLVILGFLYCVELCLTGIINLTTYKNSGKSARISVSKKVSFYTFPPITVYYGVRHFLRFFLLGIKFVGVWMFLAWDSMHTQNRLICLMDASFFGTMAGLSAVTFDSMIAGYLFLHIAVFAIAGALFGVLNLFVIKPRIAPVARQLRFNRSKQLAEC